MAYASQPIAVTPSKPTPDLYTGYSSFSPRNFFAGSPISLKTGSFQNRFYPGGSPGHSLGPIAMPDFKRGLPSSWENDPGAWIKAMKNGDALVPEDDLCRNYICCGVALPDLHALVDHFESCHVEVLYPFDADAPSPDAGGTPAFDADDMEISEPSPSPPATPSPIMQASAFDPIRVVSLNIASDFANPAGRMSGFFRPPQQYHSSYSSLAGANGQSTPSAFNRYAGYSDYSNNLPGTEPSPTYPDAQKENGAVGTSMTGRCVPPALLFSSSASPSPLNTPGSSRTNSPALSAAPVYGLHSAPPTPPQSHAQTHAVPSGTLPLHPTSSSSGSSTPHVHNPPSYRAPRASNSSLTLTKPFRCPKAGCNKSYKQQNGLKYHLSHGQCNFAPRDPEVEKLSEVERDKRLRPFVCKVGTECNRRYKNMNGLRYHYTHTGEHGAIGLEMLAHGHHPLPDVAVSMRASSLPKAQSPQTHANASSFQRTSYYPNQQQLAPPVVSTIPAPSPTTLILPPSQSHTQKQEPAPSPLSPFHSQGWLVGDHDKMIC